LAVTRALGDAYLKTPLLSFNPYKHHAPYITARPEVNCRLLTKAGDRVLILATDGVWERCSGDDVLRWIRNYSAERSAEAERRRGRVARSGGGGRFSPEESQNNDDSPTQSDDAPAVASQKRDRVSPVMMMNKKRKTNNRTPRRVTSPVSALSSVSDVIVRRVLNKVRRARNMSSLDALMSLPKGRARRSKHDDITASVVDLSAFLS